MSPVLLHIANSQFPILNFNLMSRMTDIWACQVYQGAGYTARSEVPGLQGG